LSMHGSPKAVSEPFPAGRRESRPEIVPHDSILSQRIIPEEQETKLDAGEERVLREAGLLGVDGDVSKSKEKRPDTSESERDRVGAISPSSDHFLRDRGTSVRRSLQRSLREHSHPHHASPSSHRHKKARESGSSAITEDGIKSTHSGESEELRRGTGSFILHGKKASVITMGDEWRNMTAEERIQMRNKNKVAEDGVVDDGTASIASQASSRLGAASVAGSSIREGNDARMSVATAADEFVDAKTSFDGKGKGRDSLFVDAKDFRSSMDSRSIREESDEDQSDVDDETTKPVGRTGVGEEEDLDLTTTNSTGAPGPAVSH
jgi:hypothetical protein